MTLLEKGGIPNIQTEVFLCNSEADVSNIPANAPQGSIVLIPTDSGLMAKMKNENNVWKDL